MSKDTDAGHKTPDVTKKMDSADQQAADEKAAAPTSTDAAPTSSDAATLDTATADEKPASNQPTEVIPSGKQSTGKPAQDAGVTKDAGVAQDAGSAQKTNADKEAQGSGTAGEAPISAALTKNWKLIGLIAGGVIVLVVVVVLVLLATGVIGTNKSEKGQPDGAVSSSAADQGFVPSASSEPFSAPTAYTKAIDKSVRKIIQDSGADVSVTYMVASLPANGFNVAGDTSRPAASMIKLLVLAELLQQAQDGDVSLDDQLVVTDQDAVGGTGVIAGTVGTSYTLDQLALHMIADSDNTACNMLINLMGFDAINQKAADLGLTGTSLERLMMDADAIAAGIENHMSANDAAIILQKIASGTLVNSEMSKRAMDYLQAQTLDSGLVAGTGTNVQVAHKTGSLTSAEHDGGIIMATTPYVLVVMTQGLPTQDADTLIAQVAHQVYAIQTQGQNAGNLLTAHGAADQAAADAAAEVATQQQSTPTPRAPGHTGGAAGINNGAAGETGAGYEYYEPSITDPDPELLPPSEVTPQPENPGDEDIDAPDINNDPNKDNPETPVDPNASTPGTDGPAVPSAPGEGTGEGEGTLPGGEDAGNTGTPETGGNAGTPETGGDMGGAGEGGGEVITPDAGGDAGAGAIPEAPVTPESVAGTDA